MKISELPVAEKVNNEDVFPVVQDGETKKAAKAALKIPDDVGVTSEGNLILTAGGGQIGAGVLLPKTEVDQTYSATSENAQSGLAVAEAVATANSYTDGKIMRLINCVSIPSGETADMILINKNGADESFSLKHIKFMIDLRIPSSQTVKCFVRINGVSVITIPSLSSLLTVKIIGEIKIFQAGTNVNYSYLTSNPNISASSGNLNSKNSFATVPTAIRTSIEKMDVRLIDETNNIIQLQAGSSIELWGC